MIAAISIMAACLYVSWPSHLQNCSPYEAVQERFYLHVLLFIYNGHLVRHRSVVALQKSKTFRDAAHGLCCAYMHSLRCNQGSSILYHHRMWKHAGGAGSKREELPLLSIFIHVDPFWAQAKPPSGSRKRRPSGSTSRRCFSRQQ